MTDKETINQATEVKQLKKADFLMNMPFEPVTRGEIVDILEDFDFIDSWLTYLIDHFVKQGKVLVEENEKGETVYLRKGKKVSAAREAWAVIFDDETGDYSLENRVLEKSEKLADHEGGTAKAAVKKACSAVFQAYKEDTAAIKALLADDEAEEPEQADKAA